MLSENVPQPSAQRFGDEIARLRNARKWSRAKLSRRLVDELDPDDPSSDTKGEVWIKRLESGRMVKMPREIVEALSRALLCTDAERARLLLYADRNIVAGNDVPSEIAILLNEVMSELYNQAPEIMIDLLDQQHVAELNQQEKRLLVAKALELITRNAQRQSPKGG